MNNTHLQQSITTGQYGAAISHLMTIALTDVGAAKACAQVLLSAYNGYDFQLDITDLGILDSEVYSSALTVIRGRIELNTEPHMVIHRGEELFDELWGIWCKTYHVRNRGKREG